MLFKLIFALCVIFLILPVTYARAEPPPPPWPWYRDLGDGMVFYMTPPHYEAEGYPTSGLYINGELIYTVQGFTSGGLFFSDDGMSFLYLPAGMVWPGGVPTVSQAALSQEGIRFRRFVAAMFFTYGELVHYFYLNELMADAQSVYARNRELIETQTASEPIGMLWNIRGERLYDRENNTLQLTAVDGSVTVFDLTTGLIVYQYRPATLNILLVVGASAIVLLFLFAAFLFFLTKKRRRRKLIENTKNRQQ